MNYRAFVSMNKDKKIRNNIIMPTQAKPGDQLIIDFGNYNLSGKRIILRCRPSGYRSEELKPEHGLLFIPLEPGMLQEGADNTIQFDFIWHECDQSPEIEIISK
jgi:hypothetical protein